MQHARITTFRCPPKSFGNMVMLLKGITTIYYCFPQSWITIKKFVNSDVSYTGQLIKKYKAKFSGSCLVFVIYRVTAVHRAVIQWFYLTREIGSRILRTVMHYIHCLHLFTSCYFALFVGICLTVQVKSLFTGVWLYKLPHNNSPPLFSFQHATQKLVKFYESRQTSKLKKKNFVVYVVKKKAPWPCTAFVFCSQIVTE